MSIRVSGGTGDVTKGFRTKGNITKLAVRAGAPPQAAAPLGTSVSGTIPDFGTVTATISPFTGVNVSGGWDLYNKCWNTEIVLSTSPDNFTGGKSLKFVTKQRTVWDGVLTPVPGGGGKGVKELFAASGGGRAPSHP